MKGRREKKLFQGTLVGCLCGSRANTVSGKIALGTFSARPVWHALYYCDMLGITAAAVTFPIASHAAIQVYYMNSARHTFDCLRIVSL